MIESELLEKYKKEVSNIPEMRQLVSYKYEHAVEILPLLMKEYHKTDDDQLLFGACIRHLKGNCNPAMIKDIINEWKGTE